MRLIEVLIKLRGDHRGTTTTEYGFILLLIVIGLIFVVDGLGGQNGGLWADNMNKIATAMSQ